MRVATHSILKGIRVVELTHAISGPQCGQILADHGADVIKVEPPTGELARNAYPQLNDESIYFSCHNRGKRSIVLDLKSPEGASDFRALAKTADVVLTNYTVDVPKRLGWGYEDLKKINPKIVMAHITGFGSTGPDRALRALDGIIQAMSGIPEFSGTPESGPVFTPAFIADHIAGYQAALGIMFALYKRTLTGEGEFVDISMLDAYASTSAHAIGASLAGDPPSRIGNRVATSYANTFNASDGFVYLAPIGALKWHKVCLAIGRVDWVETLPYEDAIFTRRDETEEVINAWCSTRTRAEVMKIMAEAGIPCGPVRSPLEYAEYALETDSGGVVEVSMPSRQKVMVPGPIVRVGLTDSENRWQVPAVGEHTEEVLAELGRTRASATADD